MNARNLIRRFNSKVDDALAPPTENPRELYQDWLLDISFDKALHLGAGRDQYELGCQLETFGEVIALDPDKNGISENKTSEKIISDGQRLPFSSDEFDLVFSEYVFEHLPKPEQALEEIDRVLRPNGSFVVIVPNPNHYYAQIADLAPFWFHKLWFDLQGINNYKEDKFPTQYKWGTYSDITERDDWVLKKFTSFPGPTGYTTILPIHFLFVLFDRAMANSPKNHVSFLAHYRMLS